MMCGYIFGGIVGHLLLIILLSASASLAIGENRHSAAPAAGRARVRASGPLATLLAAGSVGIVRGHALESVSSFVQIHSKRIKDNRDGVCSGTLIEGCVVTAAHCPRDRKDFEISTGMTGDVPLFSAEEYATLSDDPKSVEGDIAVLRPHGAIPLKITNRRDFIATEAPAVGDNLSIAGYGNRETREEWEEQVQPDGKTKLVSTLRDWGVGVRRVGTVKTIAFDPKTDAVKTENDAQTVLKVEPNPQIATSGDSGGPVLKGDKMVAVISKTAGVSTPVEGSDTGEKEVLAEDANLNYYASLAPQREKLIALLDKLGCAENTFEATRDRLLVSGEALLRAAAKERRGLNSISDTDRDALYADLRKLFGIDPKIPMNVKLFTGERGTVSFHLNYDPGTGPVGKTVEIG